MGKQYEVITYIGGCKRIFDIIIPDAWNPVKFAREYLRVYIEDPMRFNWSPSAQLNRIKYVGWIRGAVRGYYVDGKYTSLYM